MRTESDTDGEVMERALALSVHHAQCATVSDGRRLRMALPCTGTGLPPRWTSTLV